MANPFTYLELHSSDAKGRAPCGADAAARPGRPQRMARDAGRCRALTFSKLDARTRMSDHGRSVPLLHRGIATLLTTGFGVVEASRRANEANGV